METSFNNIVYSTDKNFQYNIEDTEMDTLPNDQQKLVIYLDTKIKGGKIATIIKGFIGKSEDGESLSKKCKIHCGTGGSFKENIIIIQGNHTEKIFQFLKKMGYKDSRIKK